ncbi:phage integrase SAM-like domain-containing protein [Labilibaculum sp.]|uniref:phage integrase SAM-like domain-containing protein n=1 Tax=Labilibaculum sp. TaxID=2060723 RepID=UPI00356624C9
MAVSVTFRLRDPQTKVTKAKQQETPVIMFFSYGYCENNKQGKQTYKPLKYPTGLKIKPCYWNKETHRALQKRQIDYQNINDLLDIIENIAKKVHRSLLIDDIQPKPDELKKAIDIERGLIKEETAETLNSYIERYIKEAEEGTRLYFHNGKEGKYTYGTVKSYKTFQVQFDLYQKDRKTKTDFDDITLNWYEDFKGFLYSKDYTKNSVGKSIKHLKTIMRSAKDEDLHTNLDFTKKKFQVGKEQVYNIYLHEEEINRISQLDLSGKRNWELARDLWLMCYHTAQSVVDVLNLSKANLTTLNNGAKALSFSRQKTGVKVLVPITAQLETLLNKYDWKAPTITEQKTNKYIKDIARHLGFLEIVQIEKTIGGRKTKKNFAKCDLVMCHTARRSACTNMYNAKIPPFDIMKISGHKTESEFFAYIKTTKEEAAERLSEHPFFNQPVLKVAK